MSYYYTIEENKNIMLIDECYKDKMKYRKKYKRKEYLQVFFDVYCVVSTMYVVMLNIFNYYMTVNEVFSIMCCSFSIHIIKAVLHIKKSIKGGLL